MRRGLVAVAVVTATAVAGLAGVSRTGSAAPIAVVAVATPTAAEPVPTAPVPTAADTPAGSTSPTAVVLYERPDPTAAPVIRTVPVRSQAEAEQVIADAQASGNVVAADVDAVATPLGDRPVPLAGAAAPKSSAVPAGAADPDPYLSSQWGMTRLDASGAWMKGTGTGQVVAVIDSGVDAGHEDLVGSTVLPGYDLITPGGDGHHDGLGHGTFVAGIIAAHASNGLGGAGLAPGVRILPVRVFDDAGNGGSYSVIAQGIIWAVDHGATVLNMSLGGTSDSSVLRQAIAYAESKSVAVVAAAGNSAQTGNPVTYPAAIPGVLAVGATTNTDARASFSEIGSFVGVAAPGEQIISTLAGGGYGIGDGTSFATPFVSAAAALVRESNPDITSDAALDRLRTSARDLGTPGFDPEFGSGLVDPLAARTTGQPRGAATPTPSSTPAPSSSAAPTPTSTATVTPTPTPTQSTPVPPTPPISTPPTSTSPSSTPPSSAPPAPVRPTLPYLSTTTPTVVIGKAAILNAALTGTNISGVGVQLLYLPFGGRSWTVLASATTNRDGKVAFSSAPRQNSYYQLRITTGNGAGRVSASVRISVLPTVTSIGVRKATSRAGTTVTVTGRVNPGAGWVTLQRFTGGRWSSVSLIRAANAGTFNFTQKGTGYTYRIVVNASLTTDEAVSGTFRG